MSTKAFDFYIFKRDRLKDFLKWAKSRISLALYKKFNSVPELKELLDNPYDIKKEKSAFEKITKGMQSTTYSEDYEKYGLRCAVSIWFWDNDDIVVKLFGLRDFVNMKLPDYVSNFEYWNNTDKPDEIDTDEWAKREFFYETIIDHLERLEYSPYDFLGSNRIMSLLNINEYAKKLDDNIKNGKFDIETIQ